MALGTRPCLVCTRIQDDPLHGPAPDEANVLERYEYHVYDPGERRQAQRRQTDMSEQRIYTCDVPDCGELATERLLSQGLISDGGAETVPFPLGDFCGPHWLRVHPVLVDGLRTWRIEAAAA